MNKKSRVLSLCMLAAILVFTASGSWAASTVCTQVGGGTPATTIAVASNFYGPAQDLVFAYRATLSSPRPTIKICQNSTGTLIQEIVNHMNSLPGAPDYSMFFAANSAAPQCLTDGTTCVASGYPTPPQHISNIRYSYARGVPVLVAPKGLLPSDTVGELINGAGTATSKTISGSVSGLSINHTSAELTATAKPELAPYGKASYNILNAMGELSYKSTDPYYPKAPQYPPYDNSSFNLPPWMYPTPYDNIDLTFSHVGTGSIKSGFVSKAQICGKAGANLGSYVWIAFTSSSYTLNQQALLLNNSDTVAVGLDNYIKAQIAAGGWNDFCASHCYLNP